MPCRGGYRQQIEGGKKWAEAEKARRANELSPARIIQGLVRERADQTDEEILSELRKLSPVADEDDDSCWGQLDIYLALASCVALRHLREGVPLLLERACFGDPGETMRGLRHYLEAAVEGDWELLANFCLEASKSARPGTQLWALDQLMILADPRARKAFELARDSEHEEIRWRGEAGLERLDDG